MRRVIIGMDPHKRSATVEIIDDGEKVLARGRYGTDRHSVAVLALRANGLRRVVADDATMANAQLTELVDATGSKLQELNGIGPSGAARLVGDIGDIARFATAGHFASWNGTAPLDASSGDQQRHRLSRAGNRRINRVLHIMAAVQLRNDTEGRAYYRRKLAAGKTPVEAHAVPETAAVQRGLPTDGQRRQGDEDGSGWTRGSDSSIQRGRLNPGSRHFGSVTARTRQPTA